MLPEVLTLNATKLFEVVRLILAPFGLIFFHNCSDKLVARKDNNILQSSSISLYNSESYGKYRKLQKLCGRKVLRLIGFYHNVGKTFAVLLLISMKTTF